MAKETIEKSLRNIITLFYNWSIFFSFT